MASACPHCGAPYFSFGERFTNGMSLGGSHIALKCSRCGGASYVDLYGRNARWALTILVLGFVASWPLSPMDRVISLAPPWPGLIRLEIWALTILVACFVFVFVGGLRAKEVDEPLSGWWKFWLYGGRTAFLGLLCLYGYFLYTTIRFEP